MKSQYRPDCCDFSRIDNMGQPVSKILAVAPKEVLWWRQPFCLCDCDKKLLLTLPGLCWVVVGCSVAISFRRYPGLYAGCAGATQLLSTAFTARALFLGTEKTCFWPPSSSFLQELWQGRRHWGCCSHSFTSAICFSKAGNVLLPNLLHFLSCFLSISSSRKQIVTYSMVCVCRPLCVLIFKYPHFPNKWAGQDTTI